MLKRVKPEEVRALFVYHTILPFPSVVLFLFPCCYFGSVSVISESLHRIISISSSSSGASGQTLGQRLTYFIRLSGRRDRSNTTRSDSEEEEARGGELGRRGSANPPAPSVCHIPLLCIPSGEQKQQAMQKQMLR